MLSTIFFVIAAVLSVTNTGLSFFAGHFVSSDRTRKKAMWLLGGTMMVLLSDGVISFVEKRIDDAERTKEIARLQSATDGVKTATDTIGNALDSSIEKIDVSAKSLKRLESDINTDLELTAGLADIAIANQQQDVVNEFLFTLRNAMDERHQSHLRQELVYLNFERETIRAIKNHMHSRGARDVEAIKVFKSDIEAISSRLLNRTLSDFDAGEPFEIQPIEGATDELATVTKRMNSVVARCQTANTKLVDDIKAIRQKLSNDDVSQPVLIVIAHELQLWTLARESVLRSFFHGLRSAGLEAQARGLIVKARSMQMAPTTTIKMAEYLDHYEHVGD